MNKSDTITKIAAALVKAQQGMGNATKGSNNPFFKSKYADLNSIREAALPALNENGVVVLQPTVTGPNGETYVETVLLHESGEFISGLTRVVNVKGDAQGEGSGISYSRRYGLQSMLNIGAVDDDGEAAVGRKETKTVVAPATEKGPTKIKLVEVPVEATTPKATILVTKKPNKEVIAEAFMKLEAEGKVTKETFKEKYLSKAALSTINDTQAAIAVIKIQTDFPGVI